MVLIATNFSEADFFIIEGEAEFPVIWTEFRLVMIVTMWNVNYRRAFMVTVDPCVHPPEKAENVLLS